MSGAAVFRSLDMYPTLREARDWLQDRKAEKPGGICPCCDRWTKIHRRRIPASAVRVLVQLYTYSNIHGDGFHHYTDFKKSKVGWEFVLFRYFGLVERSEKAPDNKKTSGMYSITALGRAFVRGETTIPRRVYLFNKEMVGTSKRRQSISDIWPDFNYRELMES